MKGTKGFVSKESRPSTKSGMNHAAMLPHKSLFVVTIISYCRACFIATYLSQATMTRWFIDDRHSTIAINQTTKSKRQILHRPLIRHNL